MPAKRPRDRKRPPAASPPSHQLKPLNFRVEPEFHREFKTLASQQGISMLELLKRAFRAYKSGPAAPRKR